MTHVGDRRERAIEEHADAVLIAYDSALARVGRRKRALPATSGRWAFDYATLLAALAFCAAQILAQVPITPGGLGFVEAGLTAMLTLAGAAVSTAT